MIFSPGRYARTLESHQPNRAPNHSSRRYLRTNRVANADEFYIRFKILNKKGKKWKKIKHKG
jgi:hypothetical protein